jgi:hypothetical protein
MAPLYRFSARISNLLWAFCPCKIRIRRAYRDKKKHGEIPFPKSQNAKDTKSADGKREQKCPPQIVETIMKNASEDEEKKGNTSGNDPCGVRFEKICVCPECGK